MELGGLRNVVDGWITRDPAGLSDVELCDDLIALRREADRLECAIAQLAATAHRRGCADLTGQTSTAKWMEWNCGQHAVEARRSIDAGLALEHLPLVRAAWAAGEISASAARTIARGRHAGHGDEYDEVVPMLVDLAKEHYFAEMHLVIRRYRQCIETEPREPKGVHLSETTDGYRLDGTLSKTDGSILKAALEAATPPPVEGDTSTPAQRRGAALVFLGKYYLDHPDFTGADAGTRAPHVAISYDWKTRTGTISGLPDMPIPDYEIGRLMCDCNTTEVIQGRHGRPLYVGRRSRLATDAQRTAVFVRDRRCRFPGCDRPPKWCEVHHVIPWEIGGPTDVDNLILLCTHHHHVVHRHGWNAHYDPVANEFTVTTPTGHVMTARARAPAAV